MSRSSFVGTVGWLTERLSPLSQPRRVLDHFVVGTCCGIQMLVQKKTVAGYYQIFVFLAKLTEDIS